MSKQQVGKISTRLVAKSNGEVLWMPPKRVEHFRPAFADMVHSMTSLSLESRLAEVDFIRGAGLNEHQFCQLGELCTYMARKPGTVVFQQGDPVSRP